MAHHPTNSAIRLLDGAFYAGDPHPYFSWLRAHAPVYWDDHGGVWGISRYEEILAISKEPQTFSSAQGSRPDTPPLPHMIDTDDPVHRRRRALVNRGFTPRRVAEGEARVREIAVELIERAKAQREFDFVHDLAAWLPLIVIGDMLGVLPQDYPDLLRWSDEMVLASGTQDEATLMRGNQAFLAYHDYQTRVIADRRSSAPQADLVSILVHAQSAEGKLTDDEVLWETLLILIGGDETTRHVLTGGMYEFLLAPDQWERLRTDRKLLPTAVDEMIRWVTPIQNMARTATRDVMLCGQDIAAGDKLLLLYPSANRDDAAFPRPFEFDISRTPNDHLAFGYGAHYCLGASLARLEARVFFEELLTRIPRLERTDAEPPPRRCSNFITGIETLRVRVVDT